MYYMYLNLHMINAAAERLTYGFLNEAKLSKTFV